MTKKKVYHLEERTQTLLASGHTLVEFHWKISECSFDFLMVSEVHLALAFDLSHEKIQGWKISLNKFLTVTMFSFGKVHAVQN